MADAEYDAEQASLQNAEVLEQEQCKKIFTIPEENLPRLEIEITALAKRAVKLGLPEPTLTILSHEDRTWHDNDGLGFDRVRRWFQVEISGDTPVLAGHTLVAVLSHQDEGSVLVLSVPGQECPPRYRTANPDDCDHCHQRRRRRDTFVVRNRAGDHLQVGRDCLRDFLGHENPEALARYLEALHELVTSSSWEEDGGGHSGGSRRVRVRNAVALAAGAIQRFGWVSKQMEEATFVPSTASRVRTNLTRRVESDELVTPDYVTGDAAIGYYRATLEVKPDADRSDFEHNLSVLLSQESAKPEQIGFLAFVPQGYLRHIEQEAERAKVRQSRHVGAVGQRLVLDLTVLSTRTMPDNGWGETTLYRFADSSGNAFVAFVSGALTLETGQTVHLKATIKAHEMRNDIDQTVLTRLAIEPTPSEKAKAKAERKARRERDAAAHLAYTAHLLAMARERQRTFPELLADVPDYAGAWNVYCGLTDGSLALTASLPYAGAPALKTTILARRDAKVVEVRAERDQIGRQITAFVSEYSGDYPKSPEYQALAARWRQADNQENSLRCLGYDLESH